MTWSDATTPLDPGSCLGGCWADDLAEFIGVGAGPPSSTLVLKTIADEVSPDTGYADAWIEKDLGAAYSELWITVVISYTAEQLAFWVAAFNGSPNFVELLVAGGLFDYVGDRVFLHDSGGGFGWSTNYGSAAPPSSPNEQHTVEYHYKNGDAHGQQIYVDGVLIVDGSDGGDGSYQFLRIGQDLYNNSVDPDPNPDPVYYGSVSVGSTRGGSDIAFDDFSSGDLSYWDTVVGNVSVVASPSPAIIRSPDGVNWDYEASPFDDGAGYGAVYSGLVGLYGVVGSSPDYADAIITSQGDGAWAGMGNPFVGVGVGNRVTVRSSDDAILAVGYDQAERVVFSLSTDGGATWTRSAPFGPPHILGFDVAIRDSDGLILIGGQNNNFPGDYAAISTNGGAGWTTSSPFGGSFFGSAFGCAVRASDGALVVVGVAGSTACMAISTDDGATWVTHQPFGNVASFAKSVAIRTSDGAIVVSGSKRFAGKQVAYSTDDGATWTLISGPFGSSGQPSGNDIVVRDSDDALILVGNDGSEAIQFAISTDSGATWTTRSPFGAFSFGFGVALRDSDGLILIAGSSHVGISTDDGATWTLSAPLGATPYQGCAVRASDGALVVVGSSATGGSELAISTDDGATWTLSAPFSVGISAGTCIACKQSSGAVIVGGASGLSVIATAPDLGTPAVAVDSPFATVAAIDYSPGEDRWIAGGQAVAAASTDDGATWATLSHPMTTILGVYRDEAKGNWWLLGQTTGSHSLAVSNDSGATWTEIAAPLDPVAGLGGAYAMVRTDAGLALGGIDATGTNQMCASDDDGATWALDADPAPFGSALPGVCYALAYSPALSLAVAFGAG